MHRHRLSLLVPALAMSVVACGSSSQETPRAPAPTAAVASPPGESNTAAYAPAGTTFTAHLDRALDTRTTRAGEPLTATLADPIRATDGTVLVDAGAKISGRVVAIDRTPRGPVMLLQFDALETPHGSMPIGVRILSSEQARYQVVPSQSGVHNAPSMGSAPNAPPEVQIAMPPGAVVRLVLTRPIVEGGRS